MLEELAAISKDDDTEMESSDDGELSDKNDSDEENDQVDQNVILADKQLKEQNEKKEKETSLII